MTTYYLAGTCRCEASEAADYAARYGSPAVYREPYICYLLPRPVQFGQRPFKVKPGEQVYNA